MERHAYQHQRMVEGQLRKAKAGQNRAGQQEALEGKEREAWLLG